MERDRGKQQTEGTREKIYRERNRGQRQMTKDRRG
jgi:hypothetical protein